MKFIFCPRINFMFGVGNNRIISSERGKYIQIQKFKSWSSDDISIVYLKGYGLVKVCRQLYKNLYHYCITSTAELHNLEMLTKMDVEKFHLAHCRIEQFHRAIKQVCNIERFQVRNKNPIKNHIFSALKAFVKLEFMRFNQAISHWYELKRNLYLSTI